MGPRSRPWRVSHPTDRTVTPGTFQTSCSEGGGITGWGRIWVALQPAAGLKSVQGSSLVLQPHQKRGCPLLNGKAPENCTAHRGRRGSEKLPKICHQGSEAAQQVVLSVSPLANAPHCDPLLDAHLRGRLWGTTCSSGTQLQRGPATPRSRLSRKRRTSSSHAKTLSLTSPPHRCLETSQPGWEDLGWENVAYCPLYQVILFDWMVCLSNACNPCKLQLEEVTLARGCHDKYFQLHSSSTRSITRRSKILQRWSEVWDLEADGQKARLPQDPTRHPPDTLTSGPLHVPFLSTQPWTHPTRNAEWIPYRDRIATRNSNPESGSQKSHILKGKAPNTEFLSRCNDDTELNTEFRIRRASRYGTGIRKFKPHSVQV